MLTLQLWIGTFTQITRSSNAIKERIRALLAVSILSTSIRLNAIHGLCGVPIRMVPTSQTIPFGNLLSLPPPFSPTAPEELLLSQFPSMTSASFFEDGEWAGLYSMSFNGILPPQIDPPMEGIQFSASPCFEHHRRLLLKASGRDRVGAFSLDGSFSTETLQFTATKSYTHGIRWYWNCVLLPCGFVGTWGCGNYGGWLWLWKASWAGGRVCGRRANK